jgi:hypothetical protein
MNLASYLMMTVTPLSEVTFETQNSAANENRRRIAKRRAEEMELRYKVVMVGKELSTVQIGRAVGVSRALTGLRKLEKRGKARMVRMSSDSRGRKQAIWVWNEPTAGGA